METIDILICSVRSTELSITQQIIHNEGKGLIHPMIQSVLLNVLWKYGLVIEI